MKYILSSLFALTIFASNAQSQLFKESNPQVIYNMYVESVEPLHRAFEKSLTIVHKPDFTGKDLMKLYKNCDYALETYHKDRLHRDVYTAGKVYLKEMDTLIKLVAPILDEIDAADDGAISGLISQMQDISIKEKPIASEYRESILKVIELFKEDWDLWLEDEVIYFARLSAIDRNKIYETGFGVKGLHAVKRRFYTADYFVVDMEKDVTGARVNSIKASFEDLSELPDHMVQNVPEFIESVEEPLLRYNFYKSVKDNVYTYKRGANTTNDFVAKMIEVTVISESSNTISIKFTY